MFRMLLSLDCESGSLLRRSFIVSAIVSDENGVEKDRFIARWPMPESDMSEWVKENVLPKCEDIKNTHGSYEDLVRDFVAFWRKWDKPTIVGHMPFPVETNFLRDCYELGPIEELEGFFGIFTLETSLAAMGLRFDSVDEFVRENKLLHAEHENTHNPTYDALAALAAHTELGRQLREAIHRWEEDVTKNRELSGRPEMHHEFKSGSRGFDKLK